MKTIADALLAFDTGLEGVYDKAEADSIKYLALSHISGMSKAQLRAFPERELTSAQAENLAEVITELRTGKPIQYILGETEFYGLPFKVTPAVLIPRPETEELVEWVLEAASRKLQATSVFLAESSILDIGTGSGCIPITLKKHLPGAVVSAMDVSVDALAVARLNADLNGVEVEFIEMDILKPVLIPHTRYSILTSNPPYVTEFEKSEMHGNVLDHEPHLALFVSDDDPLIFYRAIAEFALGHLEDNGLLFFEINENLGRETVKLLEGKGFRDVVLRRDMRGKDRMVRAIFKFPS